MAGPGLSRGRGDDETRRARSVDAWFLRWLGPELYVLCRQRPQFDRGVLRGRWKWRSRYAGTDGAGHPNEQGLVSAEPAAFASEVVAEEQRQPAAERDPSRDELCRE